MAQPFKFSFSVEDASKRNSSPSLSSEEKQSINGCKDSSVNNYNSRNEERLPLLILDKNRLLNSIKNRPRIDWNFDVITLSSKSNQGVACHSFAPLLYRTNISDPYSKANASAHGHVADPSGVHGQVDEQIKLIDSQNTDIIPGVYEGGLKIWECSVDLCEHLANEISELEANQEYSSNDDNCSRGGATKISSKSLGCNDCFHSLGKGGSILELGCGHGLPACLLLREVVKRQSSYSNKKKYPIVFFSDYNEFVLSDATFPNILANSNNTTLKNSVHNISHESLKSNVCLIAGDWMKLSEQLSKGTLNCCCDGVPSEGRLDMILAAETTYTASSASETALFLVRHLKVETGVGLIATKRYYFGVGGGADAFRDAASKQIICINGLNYGLHIEHVREYDSGKANIRDLFRVRCVRK